MCGLARIAMQQATQALLEADVASAETVIRDHNNVAIQAAQSETDAFTLLALQAPVAADLRAVFSSMFSSLQNVADVDRMGALALHVAKTARRRHPSHAIPDDVSTYFAEMGRIAVNIGHNAKDVVLSRDPDNAAQLDHDDDAMDEIHRHLFTIVLDRQWPHPVATRSRRHSAKPLLRAVRRPRRGSRPAGYLPSHRHPNHLTSYRSRKSAMRVTLVNSKPL
jgi:phosphate transport system protein